MDDNVFIGLGVKVEGIVFIVWVIGEIYIEFVI